MSRLRFIFALALFCASEVWAQVSVRVLDYNIHRDIGGSDSNVSSQPALAKVVNYLQPDVWTINELGGNSVAFNRTMAHDYLDTFIRNNLTIFGPTPQEGLNYFIYVGEASDGYIANAIVSKYPILSSQTFSDAGGGYVSLRGLVMSHIDLPGATDLGLFTAHLKALNSNSSADRRQAEAEIDKSNVNAWMAAHPGAGAVLTGDWNESEEPGEATNWSNHKIGDTLSSGAIYHPITTMKQTGLTDPYPASIAGKRATIDATNPNARFDYLLYSSSVLGLTSSQIFDTKQHTAGQLSALNTMNGTNFTAGDSASASDHLPVFAVFTVVPEPSSLGLFIVIIGWMGVRFRSFR